MIPYEIPQGARYLLERLQAEGHEAWLVGGCVRDLLRGETPHDWDLCTDALPEETAQSCPAAQAHFTGGQHGTVLLVLPDGGYEVTTFRAEGTYRDHRHPDQVRFVRSLEEDLARRDFTVNAMAYHPERGLVDPFGGRTDLDQGVIRCVGVPVQRLEEDALRILRALRFAARLGFSIEAATARAMKEQAGLLRAIARERVASEWRGFLEGRRLSPLLLEFAPVFAEMIPEFVRLMTQESEKESRWTAAARLTDHLPQGAELRFAVLLAPLPDRMIDAALDGLRCDKRFREETALLAKESRVQMERGEEAQRARLLRLGAARAEKLAQIEAGRIAQEAGGAEAEKYLRAVRATIRNTPCCTLRQLHLTGADLERLGIPPGPEIGALLQRALRAAAFGEVENRREALLTWIRRNRTPSQ